jgi:enoyl-CoA hydratase/carnithine racemase
MSRVSETAALIAEHLENPPTRNREPRVACAGAPLDFSFRPRLLQWPVANDNNEDQPMSASETAIETGTNGLLCSISSGVATITLNRPEAKNALSAPMSQGLQAALASCETDHNVRAILLTGAGNAFCAGGDVKNMGDRRPKTLTPEERVKEMKQRHRGVGGGIASASKPTIAALPGAAVGAGLAIALACDIRIAAQSAFLSGGYSKIGLSGDYGIAWLLTRTVGTSLAREMMFTSDRIDAARAEKLGLVNRVVPDAELAGVSRALAQQIADGPADAIRMMKQNLNEVASLDYFSAIDREAERIVELSASENHKEAVRAFVEKRKPVFNKA